MGTDGNSGYPEHLRYIGNAGSGSYRYVFCIFLGGRTFHGANGKGYKEDVAYTLNVVDVHGVAYEQREGKRNDGDLP